MKIKIQRSTLLDALSQVNKAIDSKTTIPILEGVLFTAGGELTLIGSDTSFSIMTSITDYTEHEAGAAVIPARKLLEVIKKMPNKEISIEADETKAIIKCGSAKVELSTMSADEYPNEMFNTKGHIKLSGGEFASLVDNTTFATSQNEATPFLQGVNLQVTNDTITAVATDRHRLGRHISSVESEIEGQYIVPTKILETVAQLRADEVEIHLSESRISISAGDYHYSSSLLSGTYPDTSKIIPTSAPITVKTNTERLLRTLSLAESVNEDQTKIARLDVSEGELFVSVRDNKAAMEETLEAKVTGDEITVSINAKYMIDALKTIDTEQVELWFIGAMSPVIVKPEGYEQSLHLVLPCRTQGE